MRASKKFCLTILVMALMNVTASISFAAEESSGSVVNTPTNTNTASPAQAGSGNSLLTTIENLPSWFPKILGMQFNGVYQNMPAFHSPYQGQNSLTSSNGEGHAFSHTYGVYLGSQLMPTLQAYMDFEMFRETGSVMAMALRVCQRGRHQGGLRESAKGPLCGTVVFQVLPSLFLRNREGGTGHGSTPW